MQNKYTFVVLTTLLVIAGISFALKERQRTHNITGAGQPPETPVKDRIEAQRSLFQPLVPDAAPMLITPIKQRNQNASSIIKPVVPDVAQSDALLGLSEANSDGKLLQGNQHKQRDTEFIKINFDGQRLPDTALRWSCARDKRTGLLWETKLSDAGISDVEHRYSWYAPSRSTKGLKNRGSCYGMPCDTHAYTREINRLQLCGSTRWRLPVFTELETLLDRDYFNPVINQEIFFNTRGASYWTQSQLENNPEMVMQIDFFNGTSSPAPIHFKLALRLVSD